MTDMTGDASKYLKKKKEEKAESEPELEPEPEEGDLGPPPQQQPPHEPELPPQLPQGLQYSLQAIPTDEIVEDKGVVLSENPIQSPVTGMVYGRARDPETGDMRGYIFLLHAEPAEVDDEEEEIEIPEEEEPDQGQG